MDPSPYFDTVTSASAFKARFEAENGQIFAKVPDVSASSWDRRHLLACRVVRRRLRPTLLPILSPYVKASDTQSTSNEIEAFLRGPGPGYETQSEHVLVRTSQCPIPLAQVWAALAMFKGNQDRRIQRIDPGQGQNENDRESDTEDRPPKRLKRSTSQAGFIKSSSMHVGSSSPPHSSQDGSKDGFHASSSGGSQETLGYVDADEHGQSKTPEDDTVRLASCIIRYILYFTPPQNSPSMPNVVEFRDAKTRLAPETIRKTRQIVAIDDGGLCL